MGSETPEKRPAFSQFGQRMDRFLGWISRKVVLCANRPKSTTGFVADEKLSFVERLKHFRGFLAVVD